MAHVMELAAGYNLVHLDHFSGIRKMSPEFHTAFRCFSMSVAVSLHESWSRLRTSGVTLRIDLSIFSELFHLVTFEIFSLLWSSSNSVWFGTIF